MACAPHVAGGDMQKNKEHRAQWGRLVELVEGARAAVIADLRANLDQVQYQLEHRPIREVDRYVDPEHLLAAEAHAAEQEREAERAFRSRQLAWHMLLRVKLEHRNRGEGRCHCGKRLDVCPTAKIVGGYEALTAWEQREIDRAMRGENNWLPDGHPALLDRRGT